MATTDSERPKTVQTIPENRIAQVVEELKNESSAQYIKELELAMKEGYDFMDFLVAKHTRYKIGEKAHGDSENVGFRVWVLKKPLYYLPNINFSVTQKVGDDFFEGLKPEGFPSPNVKYITTSRREEWFMGCLCSTRLLSHPIITSLIMYQCMPRYREHGTH